MSTNLTPEQRFWSKVDKSGECWAWTATKVTGYGRLTVNKKSILAHRFSYELAHGPIPDGMHIDHVCHRKDCVNPSHLRPASVKQNLEHRNGPTAANLNSGVRGVYRSGKRWAASVGHGGKDHHFGVFDTIAEAEAAVIAARKALFSFPESCGKLTHVFTGPTTAERRSAEAADRERKLQSWEAEYQAGDSTATIGKRHGIDASNVYRALQKRGVKFRGRREKA